MRRFVEGSQTLADLVESSGLTPALDLEFVERLVDSEGERPAAKKLDKGREGPHLLEACRRVVRGAIDYHAAYHEPIAFDREEVVSLLDRYRKQMPGRAVDAVGLLAVAEGAKTDSPALVLPDGFDLSLSGKLKLWRGVEALRGLRADSAATRIARAALIPAGTQFEPEPLRRFLLRAATAAGGGQIDRAAILEAAGMPGARVPTYLGESLTGDDLLKIERDVHGLASLVAARAVTPPLSIGLFGRWGSGKSFFMGKLRARIDALAEATRLRDEHGRQSSYYAHVLQIDFNAWNYVEANLWASLVTHIFEQLHRHFMPKPTERERWFSLLAELDDAEDDYDDAQQALHDAEQELAQARERFENLRLSLVANVDALWTAIERDPALDQAIKDELDGLHKGLGSDAHRVLHEIAVHRESFEQIRPYLPSYWRIAANNFWRVLGIVVVALAILALLVLVALYLVAQAPAQTVPWMTELVTRIAQTLVPVIAAATWMRDTLRTAADVQRRVEVIRRYACKEIDELKAKRPEARAVCKAEADLLVAKIIHADQKQRVEQLRAQEKQLRPSERLASFLEDRAASRDYRKYLGLPAMIRRDFEKLHQLLVELREVEVEIPANAELWKELADGKMPAALRRKVDETGVPLREVEVAALDGGTYRVSEKGHRRTIDVRPEGEHAVATIEWNLPRIDRIVLYVDDLDRCPADRVVEVLQAVHMLLAFPLFVVVVGVDARWITKALRREHPELFAPPPEPASQPAPQRLSALAPPRPTTVPTARPGVEDLPRDGASPHDYLEKIFQIPYWLAPITEAGAQDMITHFVGPSLQDGTLPSPPDADPPTSSDEVDPDEPTEPGDAENDSDGDHDDAPADADPPKSDEEPSAPPPLQGLAADDGSMLARQLTLEQNEIEAMHRLADLIARSPRAVKRYINAYRLLRARMTLEELDAFVAPARPVAQYELTMILLAIMIGTPEAAPVIFADIRAARPGDHFGPALVERWNRDLSSRDPRWHLAQPELVALAARAKDPALTLGTLAEAVERVSRLSFSGHHAVMPGESAPAA